MFDQISTMRMAEALGAHATARQRLVAQNVAQADTPDYKARDLDDFSKTVRQAPGLGLRVTDARHSSGGGWGMGAGQVRVQTGEASPNGNTVSLEDELIRQADVRREFDVSVTVFQSGLNLMRAGLGKR